MTRFRHSTRRRSRSSRATAFQDLSNRTNPRMPLLTEITALLRAGYDGRDPDAH